MRSRTRPRLDSPHPGRSRTGPESGKRSAPGPAAPQPRRAAAMFTHGELPATDEQCLNLNVFTPGLDDRRPVFVWLHGGGFAIGHAGASLYSGERLAAAADAVVVTVNYRLGSLGWLGHPDLAAEAGAPAAQLGPARPDRRARMGAGQHRRVRRGRGRGHPRRAVGRRPVGDGPARRAGGGRAVPSRRASVAAARRRRPGAGGGDPVGAGAERRRRRDRARSIRPVYANSTPSRSSRCTRSCSSSRSSAGPAAARSRPSIRAALPASPVDVPGASPEVDVLVGHTARGGHVLLRRAVAAVAAGRADPGRRRASVPHRRPGRGPRRYRERAAASGAPVDPLSLLIEIATDAMIAEPLTRWASARAEVVGDRSAVYRYRVDHPGAGPDLRATHTVEVPLLFGTWRDGGPGERLGGQAAAPARSQARSSPPGAGSCTEAARAGRRSRARASGSEVRVFALPAGSHPAPAPAR